MSRTTGKGEGPGGEGWKRTRTPGWLGGIAGQLRTGKFVRSGNPESGIVGVTIPFDAVRDEEADGGLVAEWARDPLCGTIIGHWLPIRRTRVQTYTVKGKVADAYVCVSHCGAVARLPVKKLVAGEYEGCAHCKPGFGPRKIGAVGPDDMAIIHSLWEIGVSTQVTEQVHLKGTAAPAEWDQFGRQVVTAILADTRYGKTFGWKVTIRDCHYVSVRKGLERVQLSKIMDGVNKMCFSVHPKEGVYTFDVELSTPRTDVKFKDWSADVLQAIGRRSGLAPIAAPPAPPANGKHPPEVFTVVVASDAATTTPVPGAIDIAKLVSLRGGIDRVLQVGKDLNEIAAMKGPVQAAVARARAVCDATSAALSRALEEKDVARDKLGVQKDRVADLERRLANAKVDAENAQNEVNRTELLLAAAGREHEPAEAELAKVTKELREIEALETDRLKVVGEAKGLATLLEALGKIGV